MTIETALSLLLREFDGFGHARSSQDAKFSQLRGSFDRDVTEFRRDFGDGTAPTDAIEGKIGDLQAQLGRSAAEAHDFNALFVALEDAGVAVRRLHWEWLETELERLTARFHVACEHRLLPSTASKLTQTYQKATNVQRGSWGAAVFSTDDVLRLREVSREFGKEVARAEGELAASIQSWAKWKADFFSEAAAVRESFESGGDPEKVLEEEKIHDTLQKVLERCASDEAKKVLNADERLTCEKEIENLRRLRAVLAAELQFGYESNRAAHVKQSPYLNRETRQSLDGALQNSQEACFGAGFGGMVTRLVRWNDLDQILGALARLREWNVYAESEIARNAESFPSWRAQFERKVADLKQRLETEEFEPSAVRQEGLDRKLNESLEACDRYGVDSGLNTNERTELEMEIQQVETIMAVIDVEARFQAECSRASKILTNKLNKDTRQNLERTVRDAKRGEGDHFIGVVRDGRQSFGFGRNRLERGAVVSDLESRVEEVRLLNRDAEHEFAEAEKTWSGWFQSYVERLREVEKIVPIPKKCRIGKRPVLPFDEREELEEEIATALRHFKDRRYWDATEGLAWSLLIVAPLLLILIGGITFPNLWFEGWLPLWFSEGCVFGCGVLVVIGTFLFDFFNRRIHVSRRRHRAALLGTDDLPSYFNPHWLVYHLPLALAYGAGAFWCFHSLVNHREGRLVLDCPIDSVSVWVDGNQLQRVAPNQPFETKLLRSGKHSITAEKVGFLRFWREVTIDQGSVRLPLDLIPDPADAGLPFTNSLGMKFLPVPGQRFMMSAWETRVEDYEVYAREAARWFGGPSEDWKKARLAGPGGGGLPVTMVSRSDAEGFCKWLSEKEWREYRIPTDYEWSLALGGPEFAHKEDFGDGVSPAFRSGRVAGYPWGDEKLPDTLVGNYNFASGGAADRFSALAPVGSFPPNAAGFYDLGGNVSEWVRDKWAWYSWNGAARGGSFLDSSDAALLSSRRFECDPNKGLPNLGFRILVASRTNDYFSVPVPAAAQKSTATAPPAGEPSSSAAVPAATNSLGMKFVPLPGTKVSMSIWETRVQDYSVFVKETQRDWPSSGFEQGPDHPAVMISWEDAKAFCEWLSKKEGKTYRLPTDHEWSVAVGIGELEKAEDTPQNKDGNVEGYPWGSEWPPPATAGNYSERKDGFDWTAPVGSFQANKLGIHDLGGNVWEWCDDWFNSNQKHRVMRGGSWYSGAEVTLRSSSRISVTPTNRTDIGGFRLVLEVGSGPEVEGASTAASPIPQPVEPPKSAPTQMVNSLGMKFVPLPGTKVSMSIWETRVQDYSVFVKETQRDWPSSGFEQGPDHPAVMISWEDAKAFCEWLSKKEGKTYRLPTDHEWSVAVGIGELEKAEDTPQNKDGNVEGYPWGSEWPPPATAGNYSGKDDGFYRTAPVGSFQANKLGIHDLGGNVWEWCEDWFNSNQTLRVLRGGSWGNFAEVLLRSSGRYGDSPTRRDDDCGFRLVLEVGSGG